MITDPKERLETTLHAIGGAEGIKRCLAVGNDAPLLILIDEAKRGAIIASALMETCRLALLEFERMDPFDHKDVRLASENG